MLSKGRWLLLSTNDGRYARTDGHIALHHGLDGVLLFVVQTLVFPITISLSYLTRIPFCYSICQLLPCFVSARSRRKLQLAHHACSLNARQSTSNEIEDSLPPAPVSVVRFAGAESSSQGSVTSRHHNDSKVRASYLKNVF